MKSAFRKISRVGSLTGGTKWYLSDDCLLAAKRVMYTVEYRRFYLRDLESIVVWRSGLWLWRLVVPAVLLAALGVSLWLWANSTAGEIFVGIGLAWVILEFGRGPTARGRICTTGATIDLPLVSRTRRAEKVLSKIGAAVRATRAIEQPGVPGTLARPAETPAEASTTVPIAVATQTNAS